MGAGDARAQGRAFRAGWWTALRLLAVMWLVFGTGFLLVVGFLSRTDGTPLPLYLAAVACLWAAGGLLALLWAARAPRAVRADVDGLHLDRGRVRTLAWHDVLRTRSVPVGTDVRDVWVETSQNALVRLPAGLPAGTVETWRAELGAPAGAASPQSASTFSRAAIGPVGEAQLPQLMLWPYLVSSLLADDSVTVLLGVAAAEAVVLATALLVPRAPVRAHPGGITLRRRLRSVTVPWSALVDVRRTRDAWHGPFALVLDDGSPVPLPPGLTPDVVDGWQRAYAPARPAT